MQDDNFRTKLEMSADDITETAILYDISMIVGINDLERLMPLVMDRATRTLCSDMAAVVLGDGSGLFKTIGCKGILPEEMDKAINKDYLNILLNMISEKELTYRIAGESENTVFSGTKYKCILFTPIKSQNKILGFLVVGRLWKSGFNAEELRLYSILAHKAFDSMENILLREELYLQSITDTLTGLYNFRHMMNKMPEMINEAIRNEKTMTMIMIDFLCFKDVNDKLGHRVGNMVLEEFGLYLKRNIIEGSDCFRVGGDEFMVALYDCKNDQIDDMCGKIKDFVMEENISFIKSPGIRFGVDVGYSSLPSNGMDFETLYRLADLRMYADKIINKKKWKVKTS